MDPNANLAEQDELIREMGEYEQDGVTWHPAYLNAKADLRERRAYLSDWLARGGFEPDWLACPKAAAYYGKGRSDRW